MTDCVIYTRVSSKEQEDGFSLDVQEELLRKYASEKGFHIVHEFQEVESAKAPGRPKFNQMLDYVKANPQAQILVEKTDRLFRNMKDSITIDDMRVTVHFVKESAIIGPDAKSSEKLAHGIHLLMARHYIDNLSEEVKKGMNKRAESGLWNNKPPYGYRSNPDSKILAINPDEAKAIQWLFETYSTGEYSLRQLCSEFRMKGFPWRFKSPISTSLAHKFLNNPMYKGIVSWNGIISQGKHEPIISETLWQKVHDVQCNKSRPKSYKHDFPLKGMIRCGHCGCLMTGSINKGHRYFKCSNSRGKCTGNPYLREDKLIGEFTYILADITFTDTDYKLIASILKDYRNSTFKDRDAEIERLRKESSRIKTKRDSCYDDYKEGLIDRELWQRSHEKYSIDYEKLRERIQQLDDSDIRIFDTADLVIKRVRDFPVEFTNGAASRKRAILKSVVSNCTLTSGNLDYSYKKPFDHIAEGVKSQDWWS